MTSDWLQKGWMKLMCKTILTFFVISLHQCSREMPKKIKSKRISNTINGISTLAIKAVACGRHKGAFYLRLSAGIILLFTFSPPPKVRKTEPNQLYGNLLMSICLKVFAQTILISWSESKFIAIERRTRALWCNPNMHSNMLRTDGDNFKFISHHHKLIFFYLN